MKPSNVPFDLASAQEIQLALASNGAALASIGACGTDGLPCGVCIECLDNSVTYCDVCREDIEPVVTQDARVDTGQVLAVCRHCDSAALIGEPVGGPGPYAGALWD